MLARFLPDFARTTDHERTPRNQAGIALQWNLSSETPLFKGHLLSGDTKFGPGKTLT